MVTQDIMADVELLSGLKFLKMVVFKEILFNFKQESEISVQTVSQYSKSKASSREFEQNIDRVNGAHYTIEQLVEIADLNYTSKVFQLMFKSEPNLK